MVLSNKVTALMLVRKWDGSLRLCVNYLCLNAKTVRDQIPLPSIEESINAIGNAKLFSTMDLARAFTQVGMDVEDQRKTAFKTLLRICEYNRMPMGMTTAPRLSKGLCRLV